MYCRGERHGQERWTNWRLEGRMGAQGHRVHPSFNSFALEWLLSLYFYTLSINRAPQTHLCSLIKWQMDPSQHTHTHVEKNTIIYLYSVYLENNDYSAHNLLRHCVQVSLSVFIIFFYLGSGLVRLVHPVTLSKFCKSPAAPPFDLISAAEHWFEQVCFHSLCSSLKMRVWSHV